MNRSHPTRRRLGVAVATLPILIAILTPAAALADPGATVLAVDSIEQVVENIRRWLVGILVTVATLFLTIGGLRYLAADGDPGEVERAKGAMRNAAIGYALAMLAPLIVGIVGGWVA